MLTFPNGGRLVQTPAELPNLMRAKSLFVDFETTSFCPTEKALNPWKGHRICGIAATADTMPGAWYIPIRHHDIDNNNHPANLPLDNVRRWLKDTIESCDDWVNNNVKFDAHFAAADGAEFKGRLVDLTVLSKIIDSDRLYKGGYGLDALSKAWLEKDISHHEDRLKAFLKGVKLPRNKKAQDYGLCPPDIMGEYACEDVITARQLYANVCRRRNDETAGVWETEIKLTPVLYDMEREGLAVDRAQLQGKELQIMTELCMIEEKIHTEIGWPMNPAASDDCYTLLVNSFGLPVLSYNEDGNPSFDKEALKSYLVHPIVAGSARMTQIVRLVQHYRKRHTLLTFFVRPYQVHEVNGVMHPEYNQAVRSGRMSCKRPNAQQLSKEAKELVLPGEDLGFLSCDYSQVEFRLIVHYTRAIDAIKAYADDPETDFHAWVAEMCGIPRKPAKTVNFGIGYGAGKRKVTKMLAGNMELMASLGTKIDEMIAAGKVHEDQRKIVFERMCEKRAEEVYWKYHEALPGLRPLTKVAAEKIVARGYVKNAYGRHLHLNEKVAHIAFNRLIQGTAADLMKERTIAVAPRYNPEVRSLGLRLAGSVHDETLFKGDKQVTRDPRVVRRIVETLEDTAVKFRVPIRSSAGWSDQNWAIASGDAGAMDVLRGE